MRPVLVALHAHPDDEAIFTGGTIVRAVQAGWRAVLIVATDGDRGTGAAGPALGGQRRAETLAAARVLGVERVEFLGYGDSGYHELPVGDPRIGSASASARALRAGTLADAHLDLAVAAVRQVLDEERAVALTSYDNNGIYGHIDHVLVHEIAVRSIEGTACEHYEATLDRGVLRQLRSELVARGLADNRWPQWLSERLGLESGPDLVGVDVAHQLDQKRTAMAAHSSQVLEATNFMGLPAGAFHHLVGTEWLRIARRERGLLLDVLNETDARVKVPVGV